MPNPERILPFVPPQEIGKAIKPRQTTVDRYPYLAPPNSAQATSLEKRKAHDAKRKVPAHGATMLWQNYGNNGTHNHELLPSATTAGSHDGIFYADEIQRYTAFLGTEFQAVTPHTSDPNNPRVLDVTDPICQQLLAQQKDITALNQAQAAEKQVRLLSGAEINVFKDDTGWHIDTPDTIMAALDMPIVSFHDKAPRIVAERKKALDMLITNPNVVVIGHPDRYFQIKDNWDALRENYAPAQAFHQKRSALEIEKNALTSQNQASPKIAELEQDIKRMNDQIKLVILKMPDDKKDPAITAMRQAYEQMVQDIKAMWHEMLPKMASANVIFEYNLHAPAEPWLLELLKKYNVPITISTDFHDFSESDSDLGNAITEQRKNQYKAARDAISAFANGNHDNSVLSTIGQYKKDRLQNGPGVALLLEYTRRLKALQKAGISPDQVINSNLPKLLDFLTKKRGKQTDNLTLLQQISANAPKPIDFVAEKSRQHTAAVKQIQQRAA